MVTMTTVLTLVNEDSEFLERILFWCICLHYSWFLLTSCFHSFLVQINQQTSAGKSVWKAHNLVQADEAGGPYLPVR